MTYAHASFRPLMFILLFLSIICLLCVTGDWACFFVMLLQLIDHHLIFFISFLLLPPFFYDISHLCSKTSSFYLRLSIFLYRILLNIKHGCQKCNCFMLKSVQKATQNEQDDLFQSKRNQFVVSIRKKNREEKFSRIRKRIQLYEGNEDSQNQTDGIHRDGKVIYDPQFTEEIKEMLDYDVTVEMIPELANCILSGKIIQVHFGVIGVRKLLLMKPPPINEILAFSIESKLIQLAGNQYPHLQYQISWCLSIIIDVCEDATLDRFANAGLIDILLAWLCSEVIEVVQHALLVSCHMICDSPTRRDEFIEKGFINCIYQNVFQRFKDENQRVKDHGCLGIAALFFEDLQQLPAIKYVSFGVEVLACMLQLDCIQTPSILAKCISAVLKHCMRIKPREQHEKILTKQLLTVVIFKLTHEDEKLVYSTLRELGNYTAQIQEASNVLIQLNVLEYLRQLLKHKKAAVRRMACWLISNLALDSGFSIEQPTEKDILASLVGMFPFEELSIQKEIVFVLNHISINRGNFLFQQFLVGCGLVTSIIHLINSDSDRLAAAVLRQFYQMLKTASSFGKSDIIINEILRNMENVAILEKLQQREQPQIYKYSTKILQDYFELESTL